MFRNVTPEKAVKFVRYCVALTCCWPPSPRASGSKVTRFKILRSIAFLNACLLLPPLIYSLYVNYDDYVVFSQTAWHFTVITQIPANMSMCIVHYDLLQELVTEMLECCKKAKSYEKYVYQKYVDKYFAFYGVSAAWFYLTALTVAIATLFLPQTFPTNAEYPFPVDYQPLKSIIFLHQLFAMTQCSSHVSMSVFCALLTFFAAARFDILRMELLEATNSSQLMRCMIQYEIMRRYAKRVSYAVRPVALIAVIACCVALVFCAINFIGPQSFSVLVQSIPVVGTGLIEVFMYAWPADHLLDLSQNAMRGVYESRWYHGSTSMQKDMVIMLVPQEPVGIKVLYIIPILSLNYYCSFVSNVMSLFTVLRATLQEDGYNY